jgi:hypothetical protein
LRDLFIDIPGANGEVLDLRQQITYLAKEPFVVVKVQRLAPLVPVVSIDARLEYISGLE